MSNVNVGAHRGASFVTVNNEQPNLNNARQLADSADVAFTTTATQISGALTTTGVTPGAYANPDSVTVDSKGRITGIVAGALKALAATLIIAGAGLTGGGSLAADRTLNVIANADASIVVNADDIQVGVLATDAQHGVRGGGTQHANAVAAGAAGFMTGADKTKVDALPGAGATTDSTLRWSGTAWVENAAVLASATVLGPAVDGAVDLGTDLLRFGDAYTDVLYVAGGVVGATSIADDINLGDGTTVDVGINGYTTTGGSFHIIASDTLGGSQGRLTYQHSSSNTWWFYAGSGLRMGMHSTALFSTTTGAMDLGTDVVRWGSGFIDTMYVGGASSGDGGTAADNLVIGDGLANYGATIFVPNTGIARWGTVDVAGAGGAIRGGMQYNHSGDIFITIAGGTAVTSTISSSFAPFTDGDKDLGVTGTRWDNIYGTTLYLAGGELVDGVTGSSDIVIGDGSGEVGITFYTNPAGTGSNGISWTDDGAGTSSGRIEYDQANTRFFVETNGTLRLIADNGKLYPGAASYDLGASFQAFDQSWINNLHLGGATSAHAVTGGGDLVIGAIEAVDHGLTIVTGTTNTGAVHFTDTTGDVVVGAIEYDHNLTRFEWTVQGSSEMYLSTGRLSPISDGGLSLGATTTRWVDLWLTGDATIGDQVHIGDPVLNLTGPITAVGTQGMVIVSDSETNTTEKFSRWGVNHYDNAELPAAFAVVRSGSSTNQVTIGGGTSSFNAATVINFNTAANTTTASGTLRGSISSTGLWTIGANGVSVAHEMFGASLTLTSELTDATQKLFALLGRPYTNSDGTWETLVNVGSSGANTLYVGGTGGRGATSLQFWTSPTPATVGGSLAGHFDAVGDFNVVNQLLIAGAAFDDANALADDVIIGDGIGDYGLSIFTGTTSTGYIMFNDTIGGAQGIIQYDQNAHEMSFAANITAKITISETALFPATTGIDFGKSANGFEYGFFAETSTPPTTVAGDGAIWAQDDDPNTLMYKDDDGFIHPLSLMETVDLPVAVLTAPSSGAPAANTGGEDLPTRDYDPAPAGTETMYGEFTLPRTYSGNGLTFRVRYFGSAANGASQKVRLDAAFQRSNDAQDMTTASFAAAQSVSDTPHATANFANTADVAFTNAQLDGLLAGESARIKLSRDTAHGDDNYAGDARLWKIQVLENAA